MKVGRHKVSGHTLLELLVVLVIIAILTSIQMVNYVYVRNKANDAVKAANDRVEMTTTTAAMTR